MKSFNHIYENILSDDTIKKALHEAQRGTRHIKHQYKLAEKEEDQIVQVRQWLLNFKPYHHTPRRINDGITQKIRYIIVPTFEELVVQHCVVIGFMPLFKQGMYEHTYASIPKRGAHKGKKCIEHWINCKNQKDKQVNNPDCKYILKMDVHHFFDSISHEIVKRKLMEECHDKRALDLMFAILDTTQTGLPLGFYSSQWLANWYLQKLDHFIKEDLGAKYYMRYMDDMVIFGRNKKLLHQMRQAIDNYLHGQLGLELKDNWQVFRFDYIYKVKNRIQYDKDGKPIHRGRDLDFMGFRFFRDRTILRRTIYYKACRKAKRISKKQKGTVTLYDCRQMLSYLGWIDCTDTYGSYKKYIKPYVSFQTCKRRISAHDSRITK